MDSKQNTTTRLLGASAVLDGSRYRNSILNWLKDQNRAVAPEVGLDIQLVLQVCKYMEARQTLYWLLFFAAAVTGLFTIMIDAVLASIVLVLSSGMIYLHKVYKERYAYASNFQRKSFDHQRVKTKFRAALDREHQDALPKTDQNLIVYKGFIPFVGAGIDLGGWSFTVAVDKPKQILGRPAEPKIFLAAELYDSVDSSIASLGLDGLSSRDHFFINGTDVRDDRNILCDVYGRPAQVLDADMTSKYRLESDSRIRHYKWIRVQDWGNELVMSFFLRCCLRGNSLFVELKRYLLTPISENYREVDKIPHLSFRSLGALILSSIIAGPFLALFSPVVLLLKVYKGIQKISDTEGRERRKEISDNPLFDYGADTSIRQKFSSDKFTHYFQKIDGDFYIKTLEREILDEIVCFLDDHNVDTSDIKERQTTILNSGIIVQGGDVKAESLAVGAGAQASKRNIESISRRRVATSKAAA